MAWPLLCVIDVETQQEDTSQEKVAMSFAVVVLVAQLAIAQVRPLPVTPAQAPPVVETRFGITTEDPDRWLEDLKDPKVQAWAKTQSDYTRKVLDSIPGRARLLDAIRSSEGMTASEVQDVRRLPEGRLLVMRQQSGEQTAKLYLRSGMDGEERLVLDPASLGAHKDKPYAISWFQPSPDGGKLAVGISEAGSEDATLHITDIATGAALMPALTSVTDSVSWLPDSKGFVYGRLNPLDPKAPPTDRYLDIQLYLQRLDQPVDRERVIFGTRYPVPIGATREDVFTATITPGSRWLVVQSWKDNNRIELHVAPLADIDKPRIPWRKVVSEQDNVRDYALRGDMLYLVRSDTPTRSIVTLDLSRPDAEAIELVPSGASAVTHLQVASDALYFAAQAPSGVGIELYRRPWSSEKVERVIVPGGESVLVIDSSPATPGAVLFASGWSMFPAVYDVDAEGTVHETALQPQSGGADAAAAALESRVVEVRSHDGVMVPLSIIVPRGSKRDGSMPFVLSAYGAYSLLSGAPLLVTDMLSYGEFGIGRAICHVRGGGEKGEAWYHGGLKATKPNTWKDFIACAEYLIQAGYTSPEYLAGTGTSAGGITIGNAMIERPDLFAVAIPNVGWVDALGSMQRDPNGLGNRNEFGDPAIAEEYRGLVAMSAYQKLKAGTEYPAVLLMHGINDPRVAPWNSFKFAARLQRDSSSGKPVLLDLDYTAGHGFGSSLDTRQAQLADRLAFVLWQAAVAEFQPTWLGH